MSVAWRRIAPNINCLPQPARVTHPRARQPFWQIEGACVKYKARPHELSKVSVVCGVQMTLCPLGMLCVWGGEKTDHSPPQPQRTLREHRECFSHEGTTKVSRAKLFFRPARGARLRGARRRGRARAAARRNS